VTAMVDLLATTTTVTAVGSSNDGDGYGRSAGYDGYGGGVCRSAQQRRPLGSVGCVDLPATATMVTAVGGGSGV
jgi:hypothetical protein